VMVHVGVGVASEPIQFVPQSRCVLVRLWILATARILPEHATHASARAQSVATLLFICGEPRWYGKPLIQCGLLPRC